MLFDRAESFRLRFALGGGALFFELARLPETLGMGREPQIPGCPADGAGDGSDSVAADGDCRGDAV